MTPAGEPVPLTVGSEPVGLRCAEWTAAEAVDPVGSAGQHRLVLLVEVAQPWPKDVAEIPELAAVANTDPSVRVLAVVPRQEDDTGLVRVVRWLAEDSGGYAGIDHRVPRSDVPDLLHSLVEAPDASHVGAVGESPVDVLLCAHGKRDRCCGRGGTLLSVEVAARWRGVRTWRCSHTGGHRFAPTGITFPDGRAWAHLDAEVLDGILGRRLGWDRLGRHHRGSLALDTWAQAAEGALLAELGWAWADRPGLASRSTPHADGRGATVTMTWPEHGRTATATAEVRVARDVPVVACGRPLEEATKTTPELRVTSLARS